MNEDHNHDRYLREEKDVLIFGCINPFCCHGNFGLPNHWKIPKETKAVKMKVVSHKNRYLELELTLKKQIREHKSGAIVVIECADNLWACKIEFNKLFNEKEIAL